ncbi:FKBP-type peptidyl-prolyl cis-trans isomerase [Klebsiella pneumoniae]|uniref:peptidylprolyl isomerase n=5 Tax=Klebsiella TaxID=570 RepID=A0A378BEW9_KLEPN|nr:FKBP-type peptidyl-prolyl cis-trans isomerase [Klebsiella pneumoniae]RLO18606.1 peptidylprolyl isomerase [Klebsiella pneumoniae]STS62158.1 peptidyl-prolyl cis-trans isomerase, FKBP-type domain [Klebsiella pneumoniae]STT94463.1 peptidyl-prolyl cis-trans isomerase, FKBP-type domain [Klebsiella pneumoniae]STU25070.1 peptidyl-prolyl cis-trans isomerase, FKBP-type domain [Klebsiella pneumoniae]
MNRAATLTLNAPLLMLVAALALSTPFTAGAAPAFLDYAQQQTQQSQAQEKNDAASAKQTQESRQSADNKKTGTSTSQLQKRITSQQAAIAQKDKLIQQLKKQLAATPQTDTAGANEQAALNKRINELQVALSAATAEKEALIKKAGVVQNNNLQQSQAAARQQIQQLTTQIQQAEAENKRLSASFTTLNKDKHALMTQLAATEKEKQAALEQVKALNADKQPLTTRLAAAEKEKQAVLEQVKALNADKQSLTIRLAAAEKAQQAALDQAKALNADKQPLTTRLAAAEKEKQAVLKQVKALNADKQSLTIRLAAAEKAQQAALDQAKALNADKQPLTTRLAAAEKEKQAVLEQVKALNADKQSLTIRLAAAEKTQQAALDQVKALNADKQSLSTRLAAADIVPHGPANDAAAPKNEPPEMAAIVAAYRLQADKDNAQLRMKEDEIELLRTQLSVQSKTRSGESAAAKLSASGEQQAYAIGASMGSEALNVLTTRRTQGVTVDAGLVLQGIEDAFRGQLRLGEQERNKALFDVSQQVFQNLNKIEQKNISAGKKYQQAFARKKDVVFKEGVYSRVDYPGKGKISGNDLVTVVIKEMLTDGTVINDMEAKDQALTQKLDAYPPVFREPLKRLQNHGSVTLVVPPEKAYGSKGLPPKIPPGATMVYSVRIVDSQPEPAK